MLMDEGIGFRRYSSATGNGNRRRRTYGELHDRLAQLGASLLIKTIGAGGCRNR